MPLVDAAANACLWPRRAHREPVEATVVLSATYRTLRPYGRRPHIRHRCSRRRPGAAERRLGPGQGMRHHPLTTILGHPTGRQLLRRSGYDVDLEAVPRACAKHGVAVEINANPYRLELNWRWHQRALKLGCLLSIDPDAHSIAELGLVRWGVAIARKGMLQKKQVLSCFTRPALLAHLAKRKRARARARRAKR